MEAMRNLLLAWVLTLPVCVFLGSMLFALGNYMILNHNFGLHFSRCKGLHRSSIAWKLVRALPAASVRVA